MALHCFTIKIAPYPLKIFISVISFSLLSLYLILLYDLFSVFSLFLNLFSMTGANSEIHQQLIRSSLCSSFGKMFNWCLWCLMV